MESSKNRSDLPGLTQTSPGGFLGGGRATFAGDEPQRTFACSARQKLPVRVLWPDGEVSHIANLPPNSLSVIQRPSRGSIQPPSSPALRLVELEDDSCRKANFEHVHHEQLFNDFSRQMLLPRLESQAGPGMGVCGSISIRTAGKSS